MLPRKSVTYERSYLVDEIEGKIVIDIAKKLGEPTSREKVILALHGVSGTS